MSNDGFFLYILHNSLNKDLPKILASLDVKCDDDSGGTALVIIIPLVMSCMRSLTVRTDLECKLNLKKTII